MPHAKLDMSNLWPIFRFYYLFNLIFHPNVFPIKKSKIAGLVKLIVGSKIDIFNNRNMEIHADLNWSLLQDS